MSTLRLKLALAATLSLAFASRPLGAAEAPRQTPAAQCQPQQFDYAARERQVASGDQRIAPLTPDQFTPEAKEISDSLQAFFGAKEEGIPKTFATMFKHPGLYRAHLQLGLELNRNGKIPPRERELAILRTAWLVRSPFEWGEHVAYGHNLGLTAEEIERITIGSTAPGWNEHDRAILRAVEELMSDHAISDETWVTLDKTWDEPQLMELPGLVGSYTLTAMLYNSLRFGLLKGNEGFCQR